MVDNDYAGMEAGPIDQDGPNVPNPQMTINEAKQFFARFKDDLRPDVEALVSLFRDSEIDAPLANGNFLHALSLTELMIDHTRQSFSMLTGGSGDGFLSCLKDNLRRMLARVRSVGGQARIIVINGDRDPSACMTELQREFAGTLEVKTVFAAPGTNITHFIVCDDDMVRDEEPHPPLSDVASANLIKAKVFFRNRPKAKAFAFRFNSIWQALTPAAQPV